MRLFQRPIASWAGINILLRSARSSPELAFPVNSQVPPVAYASQPYQFIFSESTFRSDVPAVSYTLTDAPDWLSLDADRRSLQGHPEPSDVGASTFQLRASDGKSDASSPVTLVVVDRPSIALGRALQPDLEAAGLVSAPSTLLLKPLEPFSITFSTEVFSGTSASTTYYATSANNSPLPPWIQFDASRLYFSGTSPPLLSSAEQQQFYGISLIASNVPGFAEASVIFYIAVAYRSLLFSPTTVSLSVVQGTEFRSPSLRQNLSLDSNPILPAELTSVIADLPAWLYLDASNIALSGKVPEVFRFGTFSISAIDMYGDTANMTIELKADENDTTLPDQTLSTTAIIGEDFSYTLPTAVLVGPAQVSAAPEDVPDWLTFCAENRTLQGHVPDNTAQPQDVTIKLSATGDGYLSVIQLFVHLVQNGEAFPTKSLSAAPTSATTIAATPTEQTKNGNESASDWTRGKHIIVLASVIPTFFVLLCILVMMFWLRKTSKRKEKGKGIEESWERKSHGPIEVLSHEDALPDTVDLPPIEANSRKSSTRHITPTQAPQVDIPWAPDSLQRTKERMSKKLQKRKLGSFDSSWSGLVTRLDTRSGLELPDSAISVWQSVEPSTPPPMPIYPATRQFQRTKASSLRKSNGRQERASKVLSVNNRQVGLPQRRSGAGHGAGILTAGSAPQRSSWQTTLWVYPAG